MTASDYNAHRHKKELFKIAALSSIGTVMLKFMDFTCKFTTHNYNPEVKPAIYAIYHGWQYNLGGIPDRKNLNILISQSNDGEIIARIVQNMGFSTIRGSMGRGGRKATVEILKALKEGKNIAYTVDGPKGPVFEVKKGIIKIAQMAEVPIIPVFGDADNSLELNTWDKYQVFLPFARLPLVFGNPIHVPPGEENVEKYRGFLEQELLRFKNEQGKKKIKLEQLSRYFRISSIYKP